MALHSVISVNFSPDGKIFATGSWDHTARLWDAIKGSPSKTLIGHTGSVESVSFTPDGQTLASASRDETIRLWDVETGNLLKTLKWHGHNVLSASFSPNGQDARQWQCERWDSFMGCQNRQTFENPQRTCE